MRCFSRRALMIFCTWIMRSARTNRCSASSRRNPTSRNTFPVDAVTLSCLPTLASPQSLELPLSDHPRGTVAWQDPNHASPFSCSASRRRAVRTSPLRTWRHTGLDAPVRRGCESLEHQVRPQASPSSPSGPAPVGHAEAETRQVATRHAERREHRLVKSRATAGACRTPLNMQVPIYPVKRKLRGSDNKPFAAQAEEPERDGASPAFREQPASAPHTADPSTGGPTWERG